MLCQVGREDSCDWFRRSTIAYVQMGGVVAPVEGESGEVWLPRLSHNVSSCQPPSQPAHFPFRLFDNRRRVCSSSDFFSLDLGEHTRCLLPSKHNSSLRKLPINHYRQLVPRRPLNFDFRRSHRDRNTTLARPKICFRPQHSKLIKSISTRWPGAFHL